MRAMPSPTWRTVPTSARSVSTSYCSIRCLRIEVISSGRSFTGLSFSSGVTSSLAEALQAAAHAASTRSEPAWRTMPPIRSGSTERVASTVAAGGLLDLLDDRLRLVVGRARSAVVSSTVSLALLAAPRAARTRARSRRARASAALLGQDAAGSCGRAVVRAVAVVRALPTLARGSSCGLRRTARSSGTARAARRSRRAPPGPGERPASFAASNSARRRCGVTTAIGRRSAPARRSRGRRSRSSISRRWSSSSSTLPVTLRRGDRASSSATSARICSSARRVSASIWRLRLLEAPLAVRLDLLAHALALRVGDLAGLGEDLAPPRRAPGRSGRGAPRAACAPRRGRGRPRRSTGGSGRAARRSPSAPGRRRTA